MSDHRFELYYWNTPNGQKVLIALEEVAASYTLRPIDISKGEQHTTTFTQLSPDAKIPVLIDHNRDQITLFESGAILLYLAEHFPQLHGQTPCARAQAMSWTLWQVGQLGPLAGQFGRFKRLTPSNPAGIAHFEQMIWRCLNVLERRLQTTDFLAGEHFTIADIATLPWIASRQSYLQRYNIDWRRECPALNRWALQLAQRPSIKKALDLTDT